MATNKRATKTGETVRSARRHLERVRKEAASRIEAAEEFLAKAEYEHAVALMGGSSQMDKRHKELNP